MIVEHATARAPVVRARLKARHSEGDEARAVRRAARLWRNCRQPVTVHWGRRPIGVVQGDPDRSRSLWFPLRAGQGFPWADYDAVIASLSANGQYGSFYWSKPRDTAVIANSWYDLWGTQGVPQAGDWSGAARTARQFTGSTTGAPYVPGGAVSPTTKWLLRHGVMGGEDKSLAVVLYDRVLSYDACTMAAGSLAMTNTLAATRYISSGDPGLQVFPEADAVHNATAANLTILRYTDQSGNTAHNIPAAIAKRASVPAPTATLGARNVFQQTTTPAMSADPYMMLASGDRGVRKLEDYTFSAAPTGTNSWVLQFPFALHPDISGPTTGMMADVEFVSGIETGNRRIYDDACLSWLLYCTNTAKPGFMDGWCGVGWV